MVFDRTWNAHLRSLLVAHAEMELFSPIEQRANHPFLRSGSVPALVYAEPGATRQNLSTDLAGQLATFARYDNHYGRVFNRGLAILLAMRTGDQAGLARHLKTNFTQNIDFPEDTDE
jgi:hypothetical protein